MAWEYLGLTITVLGNDLDSCTNSVGLSKAILPSKYSNNNLGSAPSSTNLFNSLPSIFCAICGLT